jgi:hypothetical protein
VAAARGEYTLSDPPHGIDPDIIDKTWDLYEPRLPQAVADLERGSLDEDGRTAILHHVAALGVRHPEFTEVVRGHLAQNGEQFVSRDRLQLERLRTLQGTVALLRGWRFAVVRRPTDGRRFVLNDKGYATLMDPEGHRAIVYPLSGEVSLLCAVDAAPGDGESPWILEGELTFTPGAVQSINRASWRLRGVTCVVGHPDDAEYLLTLDLNGPLTMPALGPFRGRGVEGLLDWANS